MDYSRTTAIFLNCVRDIEKNGGLKMIPWLANPPAASIAMVKIALKLNDNFTRQNLTTVKYAHIHRRSLCIAVFFFYMEFISL